MHQPTQLSDDYTNDSKVAEGFSEFSGEPTIFALVEVGE